MELKKQWVLKKLPRDSAWSIYHTTCCVNFHLKISCHHLHQCHITLNNHHHYCCSLYTWRLLISFSTSNTSAANSACVSLANFWRPWNSQSLWWWKLMGAALDNFKTPVVLNSRQGKWWLLGSLWRCSRDWLEERAQEQCFGSAPGIARLIKSKWWQ